MSLSLPKMKTATRRRAGLAPGRGMPQSYVETELNAPQEIVYNLIRKGAGVDHSDADGRTPLMMAAMQGWEGAVRELLTANAAVNARDLEGRLAIDYADTQSVALIGCDAERALDKLAYDTPIIDCIGGQQLATVIARFQNDSQLRPAGELDSATRRALDIL